MKRKICSSSILAILAAMAMATAGCDDEEVATEDDPPVTSDGGVRDASFADAIVPNPGDASVASLPQVLIHAYPNRTDTGTIHIAYPVLAFPDGSLCTEVDFLVQTDNAATHRAKNPGDWTRWRKQGSEYQLEDDGEWEKIYFADAPVPPKARGATLNASYESYAGSTFGVLGSNLVERHFSFTTAGRFSHVGSVTGTLRDARSLSVVAGTLPSSGKGTYEIDGYKLRLRYDTGQDVLTSIVVDDAMLYIGGIVYSEED